MRIFFLSVILIFAIDSSLLAQNDKQDEQLAVQYYQNGEYDKALVLFEELFNNNPSSSYYYEYYLNTLLKLKNYSQAEKALKKLVKRSNNLVYMVDLGYIYSLTDDKEKADKIYEEVLNNLYPGQDKIQVVANAFMKREEYDRAIKVYQKGRKLINDENAFSTQLAHLYQEQGKLELMFEEYVKFLNEEPSAYESIQDDLQELVMEEPAYDMLKNILIKEIQANPDNPKLVDFLSWLFVQNKDFKAALIQLKALDRRSGEGDRLIQLATICAEYGAYDVAGDAYQYLIDKGEMSPFYYRAKQGLLDVKYEQVTSSSNYTQEDIEFLEKKYEEFVNNNIYRFEASGKALLRLAEIKAIYLHKVNEAIKLLEGYLSKLPKERTELIAEIKLALGDYHLLINDFGDAQLYYKQVEVMFEDHPLGHEAKFRDAKVSFYEGQFDWALAQLNVLKGSTSELIANDALNLSLMIQDNRGLDTTDVPLMMYARADFLIYKNSFDSAMATLDSIDSRFPGHTLSDEILYAKARIMVKKHDYQKAVSYFEKVYTNYGYDILADDALYSAAKIYDNDLNDKEKAKELYEKLILDFKGSVFVVDARKRYRELRGDLLN